MTGEVHGLAAFYASPAGAMAARLLGARLVRLWPSLRGQALLGIGHAGPYLPLWRAEAERAIAACPAQLAPEAAQGAAVVEEATLPFPDLSFDRVLLVHGLETSENTRRLLREVWRVLKDDGRVVVVAPNRRGIWAHAENTPFGHGQPYSPGQVTRLLERHLFRALRRDSALYVPPFRPFLRAGGAWEAMGQAVLPARHAGLAIVEARKEVLGVRPAGAVAVGRVVMPA